jgi:phage terminase large subunit
VYALGHFGVLGTRVFENWEEKEFDVNSLVIGDGFRTRRLDTYIGCDFGFTVDPAAVCFSMYDEQNRIIYIYDEIYEKQLTNDLLAKKIETKINFYNLSNVVVMCDSAEPKSIQELNNYGVYAEKASKGSDSILKGIDWLLQHKIIVHPRCKNMIEELGLYCRQEKNGEVLPTPLGKHDHLIDSIRYSYSKSWNESGRLVAKNCKY